MERGVLPYQYEPCSNPGAAGGAGHVQRRELRSQGNPNPNPSPNPNPNPDPSPSPSQGLKALREKGYLAEGAQPVCNFFVANDGKLDLGMIGDFLGSDSDECRAVCHLMIGSLPLAGLSLDSSLRRVIALVKLPGVG